MFDYNCGQIQYTDTVCQKSRRTGCVIRVVTNNAGSRNLSNFFDISVEPPETREMRRIILSFICGPVPVKHFATGIVMR